MLKLAALIVVSSVVLAPSLARADKDFASGSGATYDCAEDGIVNILHDGGTYVITGECREVNISGANVHVTVDDVDTLAVNGSGNVIKAAAIDSILINGTKNSVRWTRAKSGRRPTVANNGTGNSVARNK